MIGKLIGIVDTIMLDYIILDVNGVGYKVFCSSKVIDKLQTKDKVSLFIETIVREDSITLFGFFRQEEQDCFNMLCKVSGVGSKVAIKIMNTATVEEIINAISNDNKDVFCRASGVGPKVAIRIINELKSSIKSFRNITIETTITTTQQEPNLLKDTISALEGLGYQKNHVQSIVVAVLKERPDLTLESAITESLKRINKF